MMGGSRNLQRPRISLGALTRYIYSFSLSHLRIHRLRIFRDILVLARISYIVLHRAFETNLVDGYSLQLTWQHGQSYA